MENQPYAQDKRINSESFQILINGRLGFLAIKINVQKILAKSLEEVAKSKYGDCRLNFYQNSLLLESISLRDYNCRISLSQFSRGALKQYKEKLAIPPRFLTYDAYNMDSEKSSALTDAFQKWLQAVESILEDTITLSY